MTKKNLQIAVLLLFSWLLFNLSAALWVTPSALVKALSAGLFFLTLYRPATGIGLFLLMMPFYGGSKPGDPHTIHFLELLTTLNLALTLWFLLQIYRAKQSLTFHHKHPIVFTVAIYWLVALLSLSTVSTDGQLSFLLRPDPLEAYSFLTLNEGQKIYSWQAWLVLGESLLFGFFLYNLNTRNKSLAMRWTFCVLAGLVVSLILGVLDFYNVINLSEVRPAFHLREYGPGERHSRLSSLFGNSGWYAQFVTLATPAVLCILTLSVSRRVKFLLLIGIMSLTEFTLILAYQRGGWLSYPLTLMVVWFCVYVLDAPQQSATEVIAKTQKSIKKVLISIPITIVLSLSLLYGFSKLAPSTVPSVGSYIERGASISKLEDRLIFWYPTAIMLKKHPILGSGNESFGYEFHRIFRAEGTRSDPRYSGERKLDAGTAHNMYFQALSGKGSIGLLSLLAILWVAVSVCWSQSFSSPAEGRGTQLSLQQRLILMMGLSFTVALSIYGNVGELFYAPINYILFLFFYALVVREVPIARSLTKRRQVFILSAVLLAFMAHLIWEYGYPGTSRDGVGSTNPVGCFGVEGEPTQPASQYRWCSRRFSVSVPVTVIDNQVLAMLTLAPHTPARDTSFTVKVSHKGRLLLEQSINRGMETNLRVPLSADAELIPAGDTHPELVVLEVKTNDSFIPSLLPAIPTSSDGRNLSVQWFFNRTPDSSSRKD